MPTFKRDDVSIYYEEYGSGYPILLFAPGGMRSVSSSGPRARSIRPKNSRLPSA